MRIKLFREFNSMSNVCIKCGEEFCGDDECCQDCKDTDVEEKHIEPKERKLKEELPMFGVPTPRSQNIYYW